MNSENRRTFLKKTAMAAAGVAGITTMGASCMGKEKSNFPRSGNAPKTFPATVVVARDPAIWQKDQLDPERVKTLLNKALRALTGTSSDADAWKIFFNGNEKPGIKLNCIAGKILSSTPALSAAIASGLSLAGVKPNGIIFWDRFERELKKAGYETGTNPQGIKFTGTDNPAYGYDSELTIAGEVGSLVSRIASAACDSLIDVSVMKDHDLAGVSGALKNYFGAIHNPNKLHENGCNPYVADLNTMPVFREKTRLAICDATTAQFHGGPGYKPQFAWRFSGILVATDMVALDTVSWHLIEEKRKESGLPTLEKEERAPAYIASAAERKLGENKFDKIRVISI